MTERTRRILGPVEEMGMWQMREAGVPVLQCFSYYGVSRATGWAFLDTITRRLCHVCRDKHRVRLTP